MLAFQIITVLTVIFQTYTITDTDNFVQTTIP